LNAFDAVEASAETDARRFETPGRFGSIQGLWG